MIYHRSWKTTSLEDKLFSLISRSRAWTKLECDVSKQINSFIILSGISHYYPNNFKMVEVSWRVVEVAALAITTLLYIVTVFLNYWSSSEDTPASLGFENTVSDVSDRHELVVTPDGWTFSIWGVIYAWQLLWLIYGWTFVLRTKAEKIIPLLTYVLFSFSCLVNIGWVYAFTNNQLAVAFGLLLLLSITLYATIGASVVMFYYRVVYLKGNGQRADLVLSTVLLHNGLAVYATWTSVATLLNMGIIMRYTGNNRQDETTVGLVVLSILILEIVVWFLLENIILDRFVRYIFTIYPVLIWGLAGVLSKHIGNDGLDRTNSTAVGALVLSGLLFIIRLVFSVINCIWRKLEYPNVEYRGI